MSRGTGRGESVSQCTLQQHVSERLVSPGAGRLVQCTKGFTSSAAPNRSPTSTCHRALRSLISLLFAERAAQQRSPPPLPRAPSCVCPAAFKPALLDAPNTARWVASVYFSMATISSVG